MPIHAEDLPTEILLNAYVARNGEVAWISSELPRVFQGLLRLGLAVTSAELWFISRKRLYPRVPILRDRFGQRSWVFHYWEMRRRNPNEPWTDFVKASIDYAEQMVEEIEEKINPTPDLEGSVYYNLLIQNEAEYEDSRKERDDIEGRRQSGS